MENNANNISDDISVSENNNIASEISDQTEANSPRQRFWFTIKDKFYKLGYENTILRLLTAWIIVAGFELITSEYKFNTFEFFNNIKMLVYILVIVAVFIILTFINKHKLDKILLMASTMIYGSAAIIQDNKFYFSIGACIIMGAVTVYCVGDWLRFKLKKLPTIAIIAILGILFTLFTGLLTSFKYLQHWAPCYDFGIFSQMFNYMKETLQPLTTCERDGLLSHFAVHFSPIYYLLLPFFFIFPSPVTLLMGQAAIIASGLIPLYLICKRHKLSNAAVILFSLCYVLLPSMANGCFFFLHENKFLTPLILWLAFALEKNKWIPSVIFTLLLLAVKEDAPVYAAVLGLYFIVSRRNISKGALVFVLSIIYFITVSYFMSKYGLGTMSYRYDNFIYDGSGSLFTVIKAVILNPIYTVHEAFDEEKIKFILQMLVPLAFMPLMIKKPSRIILLIPFILLNLMSDYTYQHNINFQYTYGSAAFLFYLMILNYQDMKPGFRCKVLAVAATSSIFMFMCNTYYRTSGYESYKTDKNSGAIDIIDDALELVPDDSSVAATTFLVTSLYDHREVYEFESTKHRDEVEYIVLDLRISSDDFSVDDYLNNPIYETVENKPGYIAIFRNTTVE